MSATTPEWRTKRRAQCRAESICYYCGLPNDRDGVLACTECKNRNTDRQRARRFRLDPEKVSWRKCSMCRKPGHNYMSCPLNPDN